MSESYYTYCRVDGNSICYRGVENGKYVRKKIPYQPHIFVPTNKDTPYRSYLSNIPLEKIKLKNIRAAKDLLFEKDGAPEYYGNTSWEYVYLCEKFPKGCRTEASKLRVANIDIEVASDEGMPQVSKANKEITAICLKFDDTFYVFGCGEYSPNQWNVKYIRCRDEKQLLSRFLKLWEMFLPDVLMGYNNSTFDVPYLVNRIVKLLGESEARRLSPFKKITTRTVSVMNRDVEMIDIYGVAVMDFLELYKKFSMNKPESYKLGHVAYVELKKEKLSYEEYGNLNNLYRENYSKFIDYNIKDVQLVDELEKKRNLLALAVQMAYDAGVNYQDVYSQVRMWETILYRALWAKNLIVSPKEELEKDKKYAGAYVKDPQIGRHEWVVSFDLNSLYPSIISSLNISPETLIDDPVKFDLDRFISGEVSYRPRENVCVAANGYKFSKENIGVIPEVLEKFLVSRKHYKDLALATESQMIAVKEEIERRELAARK